MAYQASHTNYMRKSTEVNKTMSIRTQDINKFEKELASTTKQEDKDRIQKEITKLNSFNEKDTQIIKADEDKLHGEENHVKEAEVATKKQQEKYKAAEKIASEIETKVSLAQDAIIKNCKKQSDGKRAEQKKQEEKLEQDKKKFEEIEKAENANMAKAKQNLQVSDKAILDAKTELNKLQAAKDKLITTKQSMTTKAEKQEIDG